ncbi:hypothetical protein SHKM778_07210 [Streptomyces sp. KM77-8]|uniref:Membrane transport protein MMPL domain-containing protein n=1 Tax=Streptomyces haneummycinicus TaxID=3074435 RepID=A0AAT9HAC0_9ACTN
MTEPALREALDSSLTAMGDVTGVREVSDPAGDVMVSEDGRTAVAEVTFTTAAEEDVPAGTLDAVKAAGQQAEGRGCGPCTAVTPTLPPPRRSVRPSWWDWASPWSSS